MLKRVIVLMIVVLFGYYKSWSQDSIGSSSTGKLIQFDGTNAIVPISAVKIINAKLIEREYLIDILKEKDSIIVLNNLYTSEQSNIIKDFQSRVVKINDDNNKLKISLNKEYKKNTRLTTILGGVVIAAIVGILVK